MYPINFLLRGATYKTTAITLSWQASSRKKLRLSGVT